MAEYVRGFEYIREPNNIIENDGAVVEFHTHNKPHNTHLTMGLWEVERQLPILAASAIVGATDKQATDNQGNFLWHALPTIRVQGGGPLSIIEIPAHMRHKLTLLKGPGFYRCVFANRDRAGNLSEVWQGFDRWHK